jgi:hypothetical protein
MAFHDDFLDQARAMIPPHLPPYPPAPPAAQLRRGVSTAYYALFHLLVHETMARIIADPTLRADLARLIGHDKTKSVCKEYADAQLDPAGQIKLKSGAVIPVQLQSIGAAFVALIEARHSADYDSNPAKDPTHAQAFTSLMTAEDAFLDWVLIQAHPTTGVMLTEIFMRSLAKRP